jgi:UPF0716 family protein affecting phage T7 exclusion
MEIVIASFVFSFYFVNVTGFPEAIKRGFQMKAGARIKPIDCTTCLSVWIAVALYFLPSILTTFVLITFGAGTLSSALVYLINKYK